MPREHIASRGSALLHHPASSRLQPGSGACVCVREFGGRGTQAVRGDDGGGATRHAGVPDAQGMHAAMTPVCRLGPHQVVCDAKVEGEHPPMAGAHAELHDLLPRGPAAVDLPHPLHPPQQPRHLSEHDLPAVPQAATWCSAQAHA